MLTRTLSWQDYQVSSSYSHHKWIGVLMKTIFPQFQSENANNLVTIDYITIQLAQNSWQCNS